MMGIWFHIRYKRRRPSDGPPKAGFDQRRNLDWSAMDEATAVELRDAFWRRQEVLRSIPMPWSGASPFPKRNRAPSCASSVKSCGMAILDAKGHSAQAGARKDDVFAVTKRHAETLARLFDEAFADEKPHPAVRYADYVVSDTGRRRLAKWHDEIRTSRKRYPQILVSVNHAGYRLRFPGTAEPDLRPLHQSRHPLLPANARAQRKGPGKACYHVRLCQRDDMHEATTARKRGRRP